MKCPVCNKIYNQAKLVQAYENWDDPPIINEKSVFEEKFINKNGMCSECFNEGRFCNLCGKYVKKEDFPDSAHYDNHPISFENRKFFNCKECNDNIHEGIVSSEMKKYKKLKEKLDKGSRK